MRLSIIFFIGALAFFIVLGAIACYQYGTTTNVTDQVERVDRIATTHGSYWLVTCKNEVFKNVDSVWFAKFNSSDIIQEISPGTICSFKVNGYRIPFLSVYRNIISKE